MFTFIEQKRNILTHRIISLSIAFAFIVTLIFPSQVVAQTVLNLPTPGAMIMLSSGYTPVLINGITVHPDNPLKFNFIVNKGDVDIEGEELSLEATKLIKYFLAGLTVPEKEMWVNLSPYEKNRIIPDGFGDTEMGRDLLAQDYMLKQLTASMMYPEEGLGKKFWDRVYKKAEQEYGTRDIPMNTFNKIWIVPADARIYEYQNSAFLIESKLKVMLEEDYIALQENLGNSEFPITDRSKTDAEIVSGETSQIVREILIPEIEKEVNQGEIFANLRQIYNSVILATWYKNNLQESLLGQIYVDQQKTKGVETHDKQINQKIYKQYVDSFKRGVYNYIKEDYDPATQQMMSKKYFSGGVILEANVKSQSDLSEVGADNDAALLTKNFMKSMVIETDLLATQDSNNAGDYKAAVLNQAFVDSDEAMIASVKDMLRKGIDLKSELDAFSAEKLWGMIQIHTSSESPFSSQYILDILGDASMEGDVKLFLGQLERDGLILRVSDMEYVKNEEDAAMIAVDEVKDLTVNGVGKKFIFKKIENYFSYAHVFTAARLAEMMNESEDTLNPLLDALVKDGVLYKKNEGYTQKSDRDLAMIASVKDVLKKGMEMKSELDAFSAEKLWGMIQIHTSSESPFSSQYILDILGDASLEGDVKLFLGQLERDGLILRVSDMEYVKNEEDAAMLSLLQAAKVNVAKLALSDSLVNQTFTANILASRMAEPTAKPYLTTVLDDMTRNGYFNKQGAASYRVNDEEGLRGIISAAKQGKDFALLAWFAPEEIEDAFTSLEMGWADAAKDKVDAKKLVDFIGSKIGKGRAFDLSVFAIGMKVENHQSFKVIKKLLNLGFLEENHEGSYVIKDAVGGINLDSGMLNLKIKRDENFVPIQMSPVEIENLNIEGFIPVIINMMPLTNIPLLLGFAMDEAGEENHQQADRDTGFDAYDKKARHENQVEQGDLIS